MDPITMALAAGLNLAGGLMSTFGAAKAAKANSRAAIAEYQSQWQQVGIQNQQLVDEMQAVDLSARSAIAERMQQAQKVKNRNLAWMSASGSSYNASQAIAAQQTDKNAAKDAATLNYNSALKRDRIADQIKINRMGLDAALTRAAGTISQGTARTVGVAEGAAIDFFGSLIKNMPASGGSTPGMSKG